MAKKILEINDVSKIYKGVYALSKINLDVYEKEWVSIVGSSGSGKSTLLNIIGCISNASEGTIVFDDQELTKLKAKELTAVRRDKIGFVFQQFHLVPYLNALENVMLAQYYHSIVDKEEVIEALKSVGLEDRMYHFPKQLSGGEQQRVCFARAIINSPRLILADEPTGNLDEENEKSVLSLLREVHKQGSTIIVVTHDETVAKEADRIIELNHGRMVK
ncbi:ABC transporter ATP-binding protein [Enterococcus faecalis]